MSAPLPPLPPPPSPPVTRQARLDAAQGRIDFWACWPDGDTTEHVLNYCLRRERHWTRTFQAIQMEPDADPTPDPEPTTP